MYSTPALLLDLDILERNIARMAEFCRNAGVDLRPHAKTHKCSAIAKRQLAAGAKGICCATIDEAEAMSDAGITQLLITAPLVSEDKIARLIAIARKAPGVMAVADNLDNVAALASAASAAKLRLPVLVDVDLGHHRTGVTTLEAAKAIAQAIQAAPSLDLLGAQAYGGHLQHVTDYGERLAMTKAATKFIAAVADCVRGLGVAKPIVTGGGTGTHRMDAEAHVFNEIQAGSYIFMDAEYNDIEYRVGENWPFEVSLFVETTVISTNVPGTATTDAGTKSFAVNGPAPRVVGGRFAGTEYKYRGDEHGRILVPEGVAPPHIGERLRCVVSHCDPTVVLYDFYHCLRGGKLTEIWSVDARGRRAGKPD